MKTKIHLTCSLIFFCFKVFSQQYTWVQKQTFPGTARYESAAFTINGKGYFTTGANFQLSQYYNDTWEYDPSLNSWTQKANFSGTSRYGACAFSIGSFGYAGTGWTPTATNSFYKYDPTLNVWTSISNFPGSARYDAIGCSIGNFGYVGFGYAPLKKDLFRYDPVTNSWSAMTSLPANERQSLSTFVLNSKLYIACGADNSGGLNETWEYNPSNNQWTQKANFPGLPRYATIGFSLAGKGIVGSGSSTTACYSDFYAYDANSNSWCIIPAWPATARQAGDGFSIGNSGFAGIGRNFNSQYFNDFWELNFTSANFYANTTCDSAYFTASFPAGAQSVLWHFGDGTTSNIINPSHQYNLTGTYTVSLVVNYGCGNDSVSQQITVGASPNSVFTATVDTCNLAVSITNTSTNATNYVWDFDDGDNSTLPSPSHTYSGAGTYNISLISSSACGIDTAVQTITINNVSPTSSQFSFTVDTCTQSITLVNNSTGSYNFYWNFGDSITSTLVNPTHTYADTGTYLATLITQNTCFTDTLSQTIIITEPNLPVAAFTTVLDTCTATINLTNNGNGSTFIWHFGDGDTSKNLNSSHTYASSGTYTVSLYAINNCGTDSEQIHITIPQINSPITSFNFTLDTCKREVTFINASSNATGFLWDFDNGSTSTLTNPVIIFADSGHYSIQLNTNNSCFSDSTEQIIYIPFAPLPDALFNLTLDTCNANINLINNSANTSNYFWSFGDGDTSTVSNPQHTYQSYGNFTVQLMANNSCGSDSLSQNITIPYVDNNPASYYSTVDTCNKSLQLTVNPELISWQWSINSQPYLSSDVTLPATDSIFIIALIASNICFADSIQDTLLVNIPADPILNYTFTIDSCLNAVQFINSSTNYSGLHWSFGDGSASDLINPGHIYQNPGVFDITIQLFALCDTLEESFPLEMNGVIPIDVLPNAFTPNNDGMNDYYTISNLNHCDEYTISIFNRWGILMYESADEDAGWDGKFNGTDCTEGVYYAVLKSSNKSITTTVLLTR